MEGFPPGRGLRKGSSVRVVRRAFARASEVIATVLVLAAIGGLLVLVRGHSQVLVAAGAGPDPADRMAGAATILDQKTAAGGAGFTFEILQRSTIHARPGGPQIEIPDPVDPHKSLGFADTYDVGALIERGAVIPAGFTMEMRTGPAPDKDPDWKSAYQFGVTTSGAKTFRNDGIGWYRTDNPPGVGLDPRTAALLPDLLRNATAVTDAGTKPVNGATLPAVTGSAKVADIPGVIASDGAGFTELVAPLEFAFDDQGRLAQVHVLARNTNLDVYDLLIDTTITFAYPTTAAPLPDPSPARPASADAAQ
jgi:hypothetical protein